MRAESLLAAKIYGIYVAAALCVSVSGLIYKIYKCYKCICTRADLQEPSAVLSRLEWRSNPAWRQLGIEKPLFMLLATAIWSPDIARNCYFESRYRYHLQLLFGVQIDTTYTGVTLSVLKTTD